MITYFENTVSKYPDKKAVGCGDVSYTFAEVKDLAKRLGASISRGLDGAKKAPVAVLTGRDAETVICFLAVLYSGNYYVPVDPDMPREKMKKILSDCRPSVILGSPENEKCLPEDAGNYIYLSPADAADSGIGTPAIAEDDPLYMIYTSGSTGMPKGVLKGNGAVKDFIETFAETFALGSDEIIGNQTPLFFDASAKDLYLMLYTGATMEILPSELFIFPVNLIEYLNKKQITYVCWVPTALALVTQLKTFTKVLPTTLRKVFFVGEVFPIKQLRAWVEALPSLLYVNLYGSTEIAGISCYYEIDPKTPITHIPMGKALKNCHVFLLDGETVVDPSDTERIGEVCIESGALALGYYNDAEKNASTFVQMKVPGADGLRRVLRSGDLARYTADGDLDFVSRKDFQIKHMGRRIELGEIESAADGLADTVRCACLYKQEKGRIVLFCELKDGSDWDSKTIKGLLREKISDYMIPNKVHILEKLPLNANGKIDRTALKEML